MRNFIFVGVLIALLTSMASCNKDLKYAGTYKVTVFNQSFTGITPTAVDDTLGQTTISIIINSDVLQFTDNSLTHQQFSFNYNSAQTSHSGFVVYGDFSSSYVAFSGNSISVFNGGVWPVGQEGTFWNGIKIH